MSEFANREETLGIPDAILARLEPELREKAREDLALLEREGELSPRGIQAILRNPTASLEARRVAAWALGQLEEVTAAGDLLRVLETEDDPGLVWEAAKSLGLLAPPTVTPALIRLVGERDDAARRQAVVYALRLIGDERAVPALRQVLRQSKASPAVRAQAAESLGECNDRRAVLDLIRALRDPEAEVRFWSAFAPGLRREGVFMALPLNSPTETGEFDRRAVPGVSRLAPGL